MQQKKLLLLGYSFLQELYIIRTFFHEFFVYFHAHRVNAYVI